MKNKLLALLCVLSMIMSSAATVFAAQSTNQNDSLGSATTALSAEVLTKTETVQDTVYKFLTEDLELTPAAAAGIMGNIMIECAFDPTALAMDVNNLYSFGLMMWNGPRYEALKTWCADNGFDHNTAIGQLNYLKWELNNTEKSAYRKMLEIPNTIEGACQAAILWASDFERCTRTSFGLRIYYALNTYWPDYAGGTTSDTPGIYGYYYNVPDNIQYGKPLTLYGAVVSYSSNLKSITAGVYTMDGELVTGKTISRDKLVENIGVLDSYIVFNKVPRGEYYYTITAVNEAGEYTVERHCFTVSDEPTTSTLIKETIGTTGCSLGINCPSLNFTDVPSPSDWSHEGIDYVLNEGIFEGKPGGVFAPAENMNRAMFVTVICRLGERYGIFESLSELSETDTFITGDADLSDTEITEQSFEDVFPGSWYEEAVNLAAKAGLVNGTTPTTFEPDSPLTRAQLATLMYRFAEACGVDVSLRAEFDIFSDADEVEEWSSEALSWAVAAELIKGSNSKGTLLLDPDGYATRAQVATIIRRYVEFIETSDTVNATDIAE